jgi:uncharacterized protein (TIGR02145 family)
MKFYKIKIVMVYLAVMLLSFNQCNKNTATGTDLTEYAGTVSDADGNVYHTVIIGNQKWTVENLRTTKYNDGTSITLDTSKATWGEDTSGKYCYYKNTTNIDTLKKFGALYNWYAVNTGKLAPSGWHVPDTTEWNTLQNYLIANRYNYDGTTTGNKIAKSLAGKTDWLSLPDTTIGAIGRNMSTNNSSGFTALPGAYRSDSGTFEECDGSSGYWWSASTKRASGAGARYLYNCHVSLNRFTEYYKKNGFSVRLIKD